MTTLGHIFNAMLAPLLGLAVVIPAITYGAPEGSYVRGGEGYAARMAHGGRGPEWTTEMGDEFPGCTGRRVLADVVVVVRVDGTVERMGFLDAWDRTHDAEWANDLWVVGFCA